MTFEEFQNTRSWVQGKAICPRCLTSATQPYPNCGCPPNANGYGTNHIMRWHHKCLTPTMFFDATNDPDVIEYFEKKFSSNT
jgi:hypothetical protein